MAEINENNGISALVNKSSHLFGEVSETDVIEYEFDFLGSPNQIEYIEKGCFDKETEVLTSEGWKKWPEVTGNEMFLSTDPDTGKVEWVKAIAKTAYEYDGEMDSFMSRNFDLMTTPTHKHYVLRHQNSSDRELVNGTNLGETNQCFINIAHGEWISVDPTHKKVGDIKIPFDDYVELMGWYLSEGCCFNKKDKPNTFVFDIRQYKDHREEIRTLVERVFGKKTHGEHDNRVTCYVSPEIGEFFIDFGKSSTKVIPNDIKNASKNSIIKFLETYVKGDGVLGNKELAHSVIYTSSKNMADDLAEMIIKAGFRPSITIRDEKDVEHHNGTYTSSISYVVRIGSQEKCVLSNQLRERVPYNDLVYDVTLEKYHTLYVKRNGKVTISGNCGCTSAYFKDGKIKGTLDIKKANGSNDYPNGETAVSKYIFVWLNDGQPRFIADELKQKQQNPLKSWFKLSLNGSVVK